MELVQQNVYTARQSQGRTAQPCESACCVQTNQGHVSASFYVPSSLRSTSVLPLWDRLGTLSANWGSGTTGKIRPHGAGKAKRKPLIFEIRGLLCSLVFSMRERLKGLFGTGMKGQFYIFWVGLDLLLGIRDYCPLVVIIIMMMIMMIGSGCGPC